MSLPLSGVRILDLSRLLPGPYASLLCADLGAEVIKIEDTNVGDYIRIMPPHIGGQSAYFGTLNRNKMSVSLDLKSADGKKAFLDMVETADVVLESFRPGVMDKLGVGFADCRARNNAIVFCALTGYGADTPLAKRAGHDLNYLALAGVLGINGSDPTNGPQLSGVQIADIGGGALFAVIGILAALRNAERTGEGAFVDTSMTDGALSMLTMVLGAHYAQKVQQPSTIAPSPGTMQLNGAYVCYSIYEASDGHVALGALEPKFWSQFCLAVDRPEWAGEQFSSARSGEKFYEIIKAEFLTRTRAEWEELNEKFDFCCEPVLTFDELPTHPHIEHRGLLFDLAVDGGVLPQVATPVRISECERTEHTLPPALGADTEKVLRSIGRTDDAINTALESGAIRGV